MAAYVQRGGENTLPAFKFSSVENGGVLWYDNKTILTYLKYTALRLRSLESEDLYASPETS